MSEEENIATLRAQNRQLAVQAEILRDRLTEVRSENARLIQLLLAAEAALPRERKNPPLRGWLTRFLGRRTASL